TLTASVEPSSNSSQPPALTPKEVFEIARAREEVLSRLLMVFVTSGLFFLLFPGTFLGVWNLLQISGRESVASVSQAWLQAHGHAQVFGWVGSFIFGIGFYSIPKMLGAGKSSFAAAWVCWAMWTFGAAVRWAANVTGWEWRVLLPLSALLELAAFLIFFRAVSHHRPADSGKSRMEPWIWVVVSASAGLLLVLIANLLGCFYVSLRGATPAFPHVLDQRYLALVAWGFLVPFVWGFSAKWMTVFLGLKPLRMNLLLAAVLVNLSGVALTLAGIGWFGSWVFVAGVALAIAGLRMFEPAVNEAKIRGVHSSFPVFVRAAYGWLLVAAMLGVAAVLWDSSGGIPQHRRNTEHGRHQQPAVRRAHKDRETGMNAPDFRLVYRWFEHPQPCNRQRDSSDEYPRPEPADARKRQRNARKIHKNRGQQQVHSKRLQAKKHRHPLRAESPDKRHQKSPRHQSEISLVKHVGKSRGSAAKRNIETTQEIRNQDEQKSCACAHHHPNPGLHPALAGIGGPVMRDSAKENKKGRKLKKCG